MFKPLVCLMSLKIILSQLLPHLPGVNDLIKFHVTQTFAEADIRNMYS